MLVTYVVTVYNKEKYIANVIDSLKNIKGNFRKEFIIIDDGSTDKSLEIIKKYSMGLAKTTVISQKNQGPAVATNAALRLSSGAYIHFVDGDDIIAENATEVLIKACKNFGTDVAYGLRGKFDYDTNLKTPNKRETEEVELINNPLKAILEGKAPGIRCIGSSGSLVTRALLEKIGGADEGVFVQDLSISLKCAKYSKFVLVKKSVSYSPLVYGIDNLSHNKVFESYNTLKAVLNFIEENKEIVHTIKYELNYLLWSVIWKLNKFDIKNLFNYLRGKCIKLDINHDAIVAQYKKELSKLL